MAAALSGNQRSLTRGAVGDKPLRLSRQSPLHGDVAAFPLTMIRKSRMLGNAQFEWDEAKAATNFAKHGIRFEFAAGIFSNNERIDLDASRAADGELRRKAAGMIDGARFTVVYVERQGVIRIISARRSNVKESRAYASVYS